MIEKRIGVPGKLKHGFLQPAEAEHIFLVTGLDIGEEQTLEYLVHGDELPNGASGTIKLRGEEWRPDGSPASDPDDNS